MRVQPGSVLQCLEPSCGCRLEVLVPSALGRSYRCACGQLLVLQDDEAPSGTARAGPGRG